MSMRVSSSSKEGRVARDAEEALFGSAECVRTSLHI